MSGDYWLASPFRNEMDHLECQLHEIGDRVKGVVIAEATTTHTGKPKPLHYLENRERFAPWASKIHYVKVELPAGDTYEDNWHRERYQRDCLVDPLMELTDPGDIVINADIDEIPGPEAFRYDVTEDVPISLLTQHRGWACDYRGGPGVTSTLVHMMFLYCFPSLSKIRELRETWPRIEQGGWHLTWFGGPDAIREKYTVTPHQETVVEGERQLSAGEVWGGQEPWDVPRVSTFEERDALPWQDQNPIWVHRRECPAIWWSPNGQGGK